MTSLCPETSWNLEHNLYVWQALSEIYHLYLDKKTYKQISLIKLKFIKDILESGGIESHLYMISNYSKPHLGLGYMLDCGGTLWSLNGIGVDSIAAFFNMDKEDVEFTKLSKNEELEIEYKSKLLKKNNFSFIKKPINELYFLDIYKEGTESIQSMAINKIDELEQEISLRETFKDYEHLFILKKLNEIKETTSNFFEMKMKKISEQMIQFKQDELNHCIVNQIKKEIESFVDLIPKLLESPNEFFIHVTLSGFSKTFINTEKIENQKTLIKMLSFGFLCDSLYDIRDYGLFEFETDIPTKISEIIGANYGRKHGNCFLSSQENFFSIHIDSLSKAFEDNPEIKESIVKKINEQVLKKELVANVKNLRSSRF